MVENMKVRLMHKTTHVVLAYYGKRKKAQFVWELGKEIRHMVSML